MAALCMPYTQNGTGGLKGKLRKKPAKSRWPTQHYIPEPIPLLSESKYLSYLVSRGPSHPVLTHTCDQLVCSYLKVSKDKFHLT